VLGVPVRCGGTRARSMSVRSRALERALERVGLESRHKARANVAGHSARVTV
jgi:hypothetical protein